MRLLKRVSFSGARLGFGLQPRPPPLAEEELTHPTSWVHEYMRTMATDTGVSLVLGGQWGDEGKGKLVDILAQDADLVCRAQVNYSIKIGV